MFKERYKNMNVQIVPQEMLLREVINRAEWLEQKHGKKSARMWKAAAALASVCACLYAAMPALAASSDSVYQLMYLVSPQVAQHFMPVQKSDTANGVKMEVVSAYIHGNTAQIYITMQDLEQGRIDQTTDLFDSYSIHCPFGSVCHCERVGYDERTKTVTFLITISQFGEKDISGDKVTFTVGTFLSGKKTYEQLLIPVDLAAVSIASQVQQVAVTGMSAADEKQMDAVWDRSKLTALVPNALLQEKLESTGTKDKAQQFPIQGISLSGIGFVDGRLHIQTAVTDPLETDNHGFCYLQDSFGRRIESAYSFTFTEENSEGVRVDYHNEVFEVLKEDLAGYALYGDFVISGRKTDGKWRVTFPLKKAL